MIVKDVYVVTCMPRNGSPAYTYGVFTHEDYAIEHSRVHGDKDADFLTRRESLMESSKDDLRLIEAA